MLGRRNREGLVTLNTHKLENGVVETYTAVKHLDRGGRLHLVNRLLTTRDRDGVVLSVVELDDVVTLLVG